MKKSNVDIIRDGYKEFVDDVEKGSLTAEEALAEFQEFIYGFSEKEVIDAMVCDYIGEVLDWAKEDFNSAEELFWTK